METKIYLENEVPLSDGRIVELRPLNILEKSDLITRVNIDPRFKDHGHRIRVTTSFMMVRLFCSIISIDGQSQKEPDTEEEMVQIRELFNLEDIERLRQRFFVINDFNSIIDKISTRKE